jgi:UPF0755 protein
MSDLFDDQLDVDEIRDYDDHEEWEGRPRRSRRLRRLLVVLAVLVVVLLAGLAAAGIWVQRRIDPPGPAGEAIAFVVPPGSSAGQIADLLEAEGVITDARIFRLYLRFEGGGPFQAGEYTLHRNSAMGDVVSALGEGPQQTFTRVTVPEGLTLREIPERVARNEQFSAEAFQAALDSGEVRSQYQPDGATLEGLLFPETYTVNEREDEQALLGRMVGSFDQVAAELGYDEAQARVGLSAYETVIVASLIEMEAKSDEDRTKISRVIHNRLEQGIPLGIDATFYYALGRRGGSLTQSDLAIDSPYNSRTNVGLPPTPIGIPGRASLQAAIEPEPGPWLYYVLQDQRTHAFSESYDDFLRNKARAQREGLIP